MTSNQRNPCQVIPDKDYEERVKQSLKFSDEVERDLFVRYGMDIEIWRKSKRNYFPYNSSLWLLITIFILVPLTYFAGQLYLIEKDYKFLSTLI